MTYASALLLGHGIDTAFDLGAVCTAAVLLLIFVMEATSVTENLGKLGMPIPRVISDRLAALREKVDGPTDE